MSVHAFVDESRRGDTYLVVAALVDPRDLKKLRKLLRSLLFPGQQELHFKKETPTRRRIIIAKLVSAGVHTRIYRSSCPGTDEQARQTCLARLTDDLLDLGAHRLVLDSRDDRDRHDELTIRIALGKSARDTGLTYEHRVSTGEELLWVADTVAWCVGAGGDWARRVEPVVTEIIDLGKSGPDSAKPGRRPSGR
ncbi:DUF3800 domain-containing protein [Kutzneria sp. NPDC052558]|uniref:DUF3800 domain-containing protein n=1 Tax=Kutzneria sp. NPDC052558 TaxID=3364121 RepID=UPI0037C82F57